MITIPVGFFTGGLFIGPTGPTGVTGTSYALFSASPYTMYDSQYANTQAKYGLLLDTDGKPVEDLYDASFGPNNEIISFTVDGTGNYYIGGIFTLYGGTGNTVGRIVKTDANWNIDTTFNTNAGTGFNSTVNTIQYDPINEKIIAVGGFTTYNGTTVNRIARLNLDGSLDTAFHANAGTGFSSSALTVACDGTGGYYVQGLFVSYNGTTVNRFARINSDGTLDTTFATNIGTGPNSTSTIAITIPVTGTNFYVGGSFTSWNGTAVDRLVKLDNTGTLDTSFTPTVSGAVRDIGLDSAGNLWACGDFPGRVKRVDGATGGTNFDSTGTTLPSNNTYAVYVDPNDDVIFGGAFINIGDNGKNYQIIKYNVQSTAPGATLSIDPSFGVFSGKYLSTSSTYLPNFIKPASATRIFAPGQQLYSAGSIVAPATVFTVNPGQKATFSDDWKTNFGAGIGTGANSTWTHVNPQNKMYVAFSNAGSSGTTGVIAFDSGEYFQSIARFYEDGSFDNTWRLDQKLNSSPYFVMEDSAGDVLVGGAFTNGSLTTSTNRRGIAKFDNTGDVPAGWECTGTTGGASRVNHISEGATGYYVGGSWTDFNGSVQNDYFVKVDKTTGAIDAGWTNADQPNDEVYVTLPDEANGRVYIGGAFNDIAFDGGGSTAGVGIAVMNPDNGTAITTGWAYGATSGDGFSVNGGNAIVYCINKDSNGKLLVAGTFNQYKDQTALYFARLNTDGTLDTTFNTSVNGPTGTRTSTGSAVTPAGAWIEEDPNGDIVVTYRGDWMNNNVPTGRQGIALLNPDGTAKEGFGYGVIDGGAFNFNLFTPTTFDTDALAYISAVETAGGTLPYSRKQAINTLFTDLKSAGLYSEINAMWPMMGGTTGSAAIEAKGNTGYNMTFYGGMTIDATGAAGNGTNAYALLGDLRTGTGTQFTANSYSFGFNQLTQNVPVKSEEVIFGQSEQPTQPTLQMATNLTEGAFDNNSFIRSGNNNTGIGPAGNTAAAGTYILNRNNASNSQLYKNASELINLNATYTNGAGAARPLALWNFYQASGVYGNSYANQKLDFFFWGEGLTGGQITAMDQIMKDWTTNIQ